MKSNFEMWLAGKTYMYILVTKIYNSNNVLLADFIKICYNCQTAFEDVLNGCEVCPHSNSFIYQIPFSFANDYKSEVSIYDNYEKIVSELGPLYEIRHNGEHTFI